MPHSASAKKRHRQNLRNRDRNRVAKSQLKSQVRKVLEAIESGDSARAGEALRTVASVADKAARIKSRLSARLLAAKKGGAAPGKAAEGQKARKAGGAKS